MSETKKKTEIICIGAGASGLFFALNAADENNEVTLIDSNSKAGRKIFFHGHRRFQSHIQRHIRDTESADTQDPSGQIAAVQDRADRKCNSRMFRRS